MGEVEIPLSLETYIRRVCVCVCGLLSAFLLSF